jgi:hypothetical protein
VDASGGARSRQEVKEGRASLPPARRSPAQPQFLPKRSAVESAAARGCFSWAARRRDRPWAGARATVQAGLSRRSRVISWFGEAGGRRAGPGERGGGGKKAGF